MKVVHITSDYLYNVGGIFQHIENITEFLNKTNEISIIYLNKKNEEKHIIDDKGRHIYFIPHNGSKFERFFKYPYNKINDVIKKINPDLIHIHTLFEAFKLKKYSDIPMIFTNHSSSYLKMYNRSLLKKIVLPEVLSKFDLIICPSTELFEKTEHKNKLMISNGVNINRFNLENRNKVDKEKVLNKLSINVIPEFIAISTRRLFDKNGVLDFVKANVEFFKLNRNRFLYLIVGDGEHYESIKSIKDNNNLSNVVMLGKKDNKEIDELYYISDICVIPSKMEAISISALEGMAAGTIIFANAVGGLKELINDQVNGVFLEHLSLENALDKLAKNTDNIRKEAIELVKNKYSWEKIAKETENEYIKLLKP